MTAKYTNQEAFDLVVAHLSQMEKPSKAYVEEHSRVMCAYRGDGGAKCAVGALIPDDLYRTEMEGLCVKKIAEIVPCMRALEPSLLDRLQSIHDDLLLVDRSKLGRELRRTAYVHSLSAAEVDRWFPEAM